MFTPLIGIEIKGSYDLELVILSYVIATFAAYTALDLGRRIAESPRQSQKLWIGGCAFSMGGGIWSMHFTAMMAFKLPLPAAYDFKITVLSLFIAIAASGWAFFLANTEPVSIKKIMVGGLIMGLGVAAMHYTGMAAMSFEGSSYYIPSLFSLSVLIAITAAAAALWFIRVFGEKVRFFKTGVKVGAALIMGLAVFGMHYTGMAATVFVTTESVSLLPGSHPESRLLGLSVAAITLLILGVAILASNAQKKFNKLKASGLEKTKDALLGERQNLYSMLDNLPICFRLQAPDYSVPFANKMFRERFGDPRNKNCYELLQKRSEPCEVCTTFNVFDTKSKTTSIWRAFDDHIYLTIATPFKDMDGTDLVMEMALDITEQERAKKEALKLKEEAEKANQAKSEFLSRMSHELRTPMNSILGFSQLLLSSKQSPLNDSQRENLLRVQSAGEHLLQLINEALDLSSIDSGRINITLQSTDVIKTLTETVSLTQNHAGEKQITLDFKPGPSKVLLAEADMFRLKQVLLNLVTNAIKYNRPGGVVTLLAEELNSKEICISVRDTGIGIPQDKMDTIFEPFNRLINDTKGIDGAGIGLTISRKLIDLMKGTIRCESKIGEGSCFYVCLPKSSKPLPTLQARQNPVAKSAKICNGNKKRILYVEDMPANLELVKHIFYARPDFHLMSALTGKDGIRAAQSQNPDLILLDIHLPDMDGLAVFKKLDAMGITKSVPVIALSADAMETDIQRALEAGFHSYISKPFDVGLFLETIDNVFKEEMDRSPEGR